jgi:hypothetical protein
VLYSSTLLHQPGLDQMLTVQILERTNERPPWAIVRTGLAAVDADGIVSLQDMHNRFRSIIARVG